MKKFLIASTALATMTGVAAAEVTLSGDAQMTLQYDNRLVDSATGDTKSGVNVRSRVRVWTTMTGETDSGLSFGARLRTGDDNYTENRDRFSSDQTLWVEGAYGRLTVGDVDNALENAVGDLVGIGNSGLSFYNEMYYSTFGDTLFEAHDNKGVLYTYQYGDATFFASFEDPYIGYSGDEYLGDDHWSLGATYNVNQYSFGIGYAQGGYWGDGDVDSWGLHAAADFNGVNVKGIYLQSKADNSKLKQYGIGADYVMANGVGLQGFYRVNDWSGSMAPVDGKTKFYGLGASYDLGGGASLNGGLLHIDDESGAESGGRWEDRTMVDLGLRFNF